MTKARILSDQSRTERSKSPNTEVRGSTEIESRPPCRAVARVYCALGKSPVLVPPSPSTKPFTRMPADVYTEIVFDDSQSNSHLDYFLISLYIYIYIYIYVFWGNPPMGTFNLPSFSCAMNDYVIWLICRYWFYNHLNTLFENTTESRDYVNILFVV